FEDLSTGGSIMIINKSHDLLKDVVLNFTDFFVEESCGSCVPCRCLTVLYRNTLQKIIDGHGTKKDLEDMVSWGKIMLANRCGLGQTAVNPILTTIKNFKQQYIDRIQIDKNYDAGFDLHKAVERSCQVTGRDPKDVEEFHG
ncbi:MAG: hypothetical protein MJB14_19120, partial [Spirochaetes bacterium]|nr:hypothetical protein [Spirochaetota bacterium]